MVEAVPMRRIEARLFSLGIFLAVVAGLSGCSAEALKSLRSPSIPIPAPIPGVDRIKSMTVLPVGFALKPTRFSKPEQETVGSLQRGTESVLKREIERLVSSSRFGLRRLDTDDSTLQRKPWLARLASLHLEQPDRALLRTIASPDSAPVPYVFPQTTPVDIVDFVVDSTGAQYLLFVQGSGTYSTNTGSKWFDEKVPGAVAQGILNAVLGGHSSPDTDLEKSAVESSFFLEARLVDVADRQILWHNSVSDEKRIQGDGAAFNPRKEKYLRSACERLMEPLLQAPPPR